MRILYFSRDYGYYTTTFIRNEVVHFAQKHECLYLAQRSHLEGPAPGFLRVVPYKQGIFRKLLWKLGLSANFYSPAYSKKISAIISQFRPDVVHCHFAVEALMLIDNTSYTQYPVIIHFHGYDASQALANKAYVNRLKQLLPRKNIFPVSCNEYFANKLSGLLNVPKEKFFILKNGIDVSLFSEKQERNAASSKKIFVQVSSLAVKKGHEYTIRAFACFLKANNDGSLIIAGDGPRKKKLMRLVSKLNIAGSVQFVGSLAPHAVVELLQTADVFVHHSITATNGDQEGMPTSIMEAMAMKLPVVSTLHSGIPELVTDGVNGYLVREKDVTDYAGKMTRAMEMGHLENNREKIVAYYSGPIHNAKLEAIYAISSAQMELSCRFM